MLYNNGMKRNEPKNYLTTDESRVLEARKVATEEFGLSPTVLPQDPSLENEAVFGNQFGLSSEAMSQVDNILELKKIKTESLQALLQLGVDPQIVNELGTKFSSVEDIKKLQAAVTLMQSNKAKDQIEGRMALDLTVSKELEEKAKREEEDKQNFLNMVVAGAVVSSVLSSAPTSTLPATAVAVGTVSASNLPSGDEISPEVRTAAAEELAKVLPEVSPEIVMNARDADDLGIALFGRSFSGTKNWGDLKAATNAAVPAPSSTKTKSVAEQVLDRVPSPIAALSVVAPE
jgi:hypothetical protein